MKRTYTMILCALFAAMTAIGAFIRIPLGFYPVPVTLQTLFVFLAGLCLSPKAAFCSQAVYVGLGLIGIPIFTKGGGIGYVLDPTFGYLIAFMIVAPLISILAKRFLFSEKKRFAAFCIGAIAATVLMEALGVLYMAFISRVYLHEALAFEYLKYLFLIFLPVDLVKCGVCTLLSLELNRRIPKLRG